MRKLTKRSLDEMAKTMLIINENEQYAFVGGGDGTRYNPYTEEEYNSFLGTSGFSGGYVLFNGCDNPSYLVPNSGSETNVVTYNPNSLTSTGVDSYDFMYRGGFDAGYEAGKSGAIWDDALVIVGSFLSGASAGSDFGDVDYNMIWYSQGLKDGYARGLEDRKYNNY